jgi:hypothetical protein
VAAIDLPDDVTANDAPGSPAVERCAGVNSVQLLARCGDDLRDWSSSESSAKHCSNRNMLGFFPDATQDNAVPE